MSRIGSSTSSAASASIAIQAPKVQTTGFHGRKVQLNEAAPSPRDLKAADKQAYRHELAHKNIYMSTKQKRLLSGSAEGKISDEDLVIGVKKNYGQIKEKGNHLTDYKRFRLLKPDVLEHKDHKSAAKKKAMSHPPRGSFSELPRNMQEKFKTGAALVDISYKGVGVAPHNYQLPEGHEILSDKDLPLELAMFYDDHTGLFQTPKGTKALLVKEGDVIKVIFAGTEPGAKVDSDRQGTIKTNITQRLGSFSAMYRDAAGIGRMILDHAGDKQVQFMGHSLGGGLAQFALGANVASDKERVSAMTFNTAGLAGSTLAALGEDRVGQSHDRVVNMRIEGDPVSPGSDRGEMLKGIALGNMFTLAQPGAAAIEPSAHGTGQILAEISKAMT